MSRHSCAYGAWLLTREYCRAGNFHGHNFSGGTITLATWLARKHTHGVAMIRFHGTSPTVNVAKIFISAKNSRPMITWSHV